MTFEPLWGQIQWQWQRNRPADNTSHEHMHDLGYNIFLCPWKMKLMYWNQELLYRLDIYFQIYTNSSPSACRIVHHSVFLWINRLCGSWCVGQYSPFWTFVVWTHHSTWCFSLLQMKHRRSHLCFLSCMGGTYYLNSSTSHYGHAF